jgi:hypothetical protein
VGSNKCLILSKSSKYSLDGVDSSIVETTGSDFKIFSAVLE